MRITTEPHELEGASGQPYFRELSVIGLVPNRWLSPWLTAHHVLSRLASYFNVVWVNPALSWRVALSRGRVPAYQASDGISPGPSFGVYDPGICLPRLSRPALLASFIQRRLLRNARHALPAQGRRRIILYVWRPQFYWALDYIDYDICCYHVNDEYTFSTTERPIDEREATLISRADQVFIHSPALMEKKGRINPHTTFAPTGVNYHAYATPVGEPPDLRSIPRPRIGYVGHIKKQLNLPLVISLAQRHRDWSFVVVGPRGNLGDRAELVEKLASLPNVHFLGFRPITNLPAYVQHIDVSILPYEIDDYTKYIFPLKLNESLASGTPVVATPLQILEKFRHVVKIAETVDGWSMALEESISGASRSSSEVEARRDVAREYDWDKVVWSIARTMCERLGGSYAHRFSQLPVPGCTLAG